MNRRRTLTGLNNNLYERWHGGSVVKGTRIVLKNDKLLITDKIPVIYTTQLAYAVVNLENFCKCVPFCYPNSGLIVPHGVHELFSHDFECGIITF